CRKRTDDNDDGDEKKTSLCRHCKNLPARLLPARGYAPATLTATAPLAEPIRERLAPEAR
ncbi:MAG TPA: hypothetical protein VEK09_10250, partial [Jatrophihabitantaceae bacterium]|nr:hypothetical protein [Jatrophihabitantaceae bacterium]